jgi:hypothetical protein
MKPGILLRIFYSTSQLCTALHALHRSAVTHPHFHPRPHSPGVSTSTIHLASPHAHAHHFERARTHRRDDTRRDKSLITPTPSSPPLASSLLTARTHLITLAPTPTHAPPDQTKRKAISTSHGNEIRLIVQGHVNIMFYAVDSPSYACASASGTPEKKERKEEKRFL